MNNCQHIVMQPVETAATSTQLGYCFSSIEEFAAVRSSIQKELQKSCGAEAQPVFIAVNEAVNNAFFHGNQMDCSKKICVGLTAGDQELRITVRDEGCGCPFFAAPAEDDLLQESGRGLAIIAHFVDEYFFNEGRNEITLIKRYACSQKE